MRIIRDIPYCDIGHPAQKLDIYLPECEEFSVFIYFHGGGIEAGSKEADPLAKSLTSHNIALVSANYRMYPTAVFPEFVRDAAAAVAWTFKNISQYGKCSKFYVGGSSAGGYLSMMLCFDKSYLAPYKIHPTQINGFVHDAGQPTLHYNVARERGLDSRRVIVDQAAPLYFVGLDSEYAPMLFIVSDNDIPGRYEQTKLMIATLKSFHYDQSKILLKEMHGSHCQYCGDTDENGENILGHIVYEYITSLESNH